MFILVQRIWLNQIQSTRYDNVYILITFEIVITNFS